jgi:hypothetical protein
MMFPRASKFEIEDKELTLLEEYITYKERHTAEENREALKSLEDLESISDVDHEEDEVEIDGDDDMLPRQS